MNCPRCGYARSDFDTYCLRCRLMDAQGIRPAVNPVDQTIVMNDLPGPPPPSPPARRRSRAWVLVLLTLLTLLALATGAVLRHRGGAAHADTPLVSDSRMRVSS